MDSLTMTASPQGGSERRSFELRLLRVALPALTPRNILPLEGAGIPCPFASAASEDFGVSSGFERVLQRFGAHLEVLAHQSRC